MKKVKYRVDRFYQDLGWIAETTPHEVPETVAKEQLHQFRLLDKENTYRLTKLVTVTAEETVSW